MCWQRGDDGTVIFRATLPRVFECDSAMKPAKSSLDLPVLEDANSIQVALMQVMHRLRCGHIEHKTASRLLQGLQPASLNLRTASFEPTRKETAVIDPNMVEATPLGKNPWKGEDFEDEPDQMEESAGVDIQTVAEEAESLVPGTGLEPARLLGTAS